MNTGDCWSDTNRKPPIYYKTQSVLRSNPGLRGCRQGTDCAIDGTALKTNFYIY